MTVTYRPARQQELAHAEELVARSINDLTQRHGFGPMASARPPHFQSFSLRDDPGGLWVAEEDGEMLGFAFSWVSDGLWFLAELFVVPGQQGRGIGNELLTRTLAHAMTAKANNKALIAFAFNIVSQGLYMRHGLYPRLPLYLFKVPREVLLPRLQGELIESVSLGAADMQGLVAIDARALGVSREKHHRYLLSGGDVKAVLFRAGSESVGYAYIGPTGQVGPLAVTRPETMGAAFRSALMLAAEGGAAQITAFVPGTSHDALGVAAEHGMRIAFPMMLMSSRGFGDSTSYLPRNPGFM